MCVFQSLVIPEKFQHILRVLNTNIDGRRKIMFAITSIKASWSFFSFSFLKYMFSFYLYSWLIKLIQKNHGKSCFHISMRPVLVRYSTIKMTAVIITQLATPEDSKNNASEKQQFFWLWCVNSGDTDLGYNS